APVIQLPVGTRVTVNCDARHRLLSISRDILLHQMEVAMKSAAYFIENERVVSELAMLSSDPALTSRPDPTFRVKFRNPDEIMECDLKGIGVGSYPVPPPPPTWTSATFWRRSPKD